MMRNKGIQLGCMHLILDDYNYDQHPYILIRHLNRGGSDNRHQLMSVILTIIC